MPNSNQDRTGQRQRGEHRRRGEGEERTAPARRSRDRGEDGREHRPSPRARSPIWTRLREAGGRGHPVSVLSYDSIVRAAIELADAEGAKALSMRRLATTLGVGTMSLYWYVPSKDDLLDMVVDAVNGEIEIPDAPSGDWRADLAMSARNSRQVMLRHQWLLTMVGIGPPIGPNSLRIIDRSLSYFDHTGVGIDRAIAACMAVDTFVMGFVMREQLEERGAAEADLRHQDVDLRDSYREELRRFPHILTLVDAGIDPDAPETRDERFEFGLGCVLDGIAVRIEREMGQISVPI